MRRRRLGTGAARGLPELAYWHPLIDAPAVDRSGRQVAFEDRRKACYFCKGKVTEVDYKRIDQLRRFISDRGKIRGRGNTGTCRKHQKQVALAIKRAREMALLPYVGEAQEPARPRAPRRGIGPRARLATLPHPERDGLLPTRHAARARPVLQGRYAGAEDQAEAATLDEREPHVLLVANTIGRAMEAPAANRTSAQPRC